MKCELRNANCKMRNAKCEMRNVECEMWYAKCDNTIRFFFCLLITAETF